jgi:hypothetical protein
MIADVAIVFGRSRGIAGAIGSRLAQDDFDIFLEERRVWQGSVGSNLATTIVTTNSAAQADLKAR